MSADGTCATMHFPFLRDAVFHGSAEKIFCSPAPSATTCSGAIRRRMTRSCGTPAARPAPTSSWNECRTDLDTDLGQGGVNISGGQKQRLCIARALAVKPEVLLMDEPTSALDPGSTMKVEELMSELKKNYTVVIVTHNMQQAARISDRTAFFLLGELVEAGPTSQIFSTPQDKRTEDYISGRFG